MSKVYTETLGDIGTGYNLHDYNGRCVITKNTANAANAGTAHHTNPTVLS